ncbi:patatin-like phospholipase family protein [Vitreimonas flagellata]|uniref:patatin-like phospholipase family protein n=1 Tax=Vitreimonas flagellata TaxID=2560861 RepID=UPI0010758CDE|nr:patatin-like phospholipase family protein [Vitreimonas flagellata]
MTDDSKFRVLSLDGGGAKGFYTLGVLKELEGMTGAPLCEHFHLIYGTSTGAIIATLLCLGRSVDEILDHYRNHVVTIMARLWPWEKSAELAKLANTIFADHTVTDFKTRIGIVATRWREERPMIFKADVNQAFGTKGTFQPFFGASISDAVQASCSAFPFFSKKQVPISDGSTVTLIDGGYCANNPTLYALADATVSLKIEPDRIRVVSIGVGEYPAPRRMHKPSYWASKLPLADLLQKTMEVNTRSMDQLRMVLFKDIATVRVSNAYTQPDMATDMFEHDHRKLDVLWQRGRQSFSEHEAKLREFFLQVM